MVKLYLAKLYAKHLLIILIGLELFFLLVDFLQNQKNIPDSANLTVLYLYYQSFAALRVTLGLSLIFAAIWTFSYLVKSNELTALESIGMAKRHIIRPLFGVALILSLIYMLLGLTNAGYYYDNAMAILKNQQTDTHTDNLFFRYHDKFIYIKTVNPYAKQAKEIKIVTLNENNVTSIIQAKEGNFFGNSWHLHEVTTTTIQENKEPYLITTAQPSIDALEGFKPKILDTISQSGEGLNVVDAVNALHLLGGESISLDKIKSALFSSLSMPLFAPFFIITLGFFVPDGSRGFIPLRFAAIWGFATLISWGFLMTLSKLAASGSLSSYATLIVVCCFGISSFFVYRKMR